MGPCTPWSAICMQHIFCIHVSLDHTWKGWKGRDNPLWELRMMGVMCRYYPWQPTRMMLCIFTNSRASYISRRSHFSCRSMQFHLLYGFSRKFHPHLCNSLDIRILNLFSSLHWLLFYFSSSLHAGCSVKYGCSHSGCRGYAHTKWGMLYIICYITSIHPVWKKFLESFWKYKFGATIATTPSPECGASC